MLPDKLEQLTPFGLALLAGCLFEALLICLKVLFHTTGHGLELMDIPLLLFNLPGFVIMAILPDSGGHGVWSHVSDILFFIIGVLSLSGVFYWPIRRWKRA
jgi:hypothetical protein